MVDFTSDTLLGDIRRCILKKKMDLGNIGGFRVPKKALFSGFQPFFGHFKGPEWCQTKIQGHATPAERSPMIAERICGFWFQGSFVQIMAHCALSVIIIKAPRLFAASFHFWLRQELKELQCSFVRPVLVCLAQLIFFYRMSS